eukprot:SAG22_NODE_239_length_14182_cov_74.353050_4_plen_383_part_00
MSSSSGAVAFDVDLSSIPIGEKEAAAEKGQYVDYLASLNLERLKAEPSQLQAEFESVQRQIEEYAFANYRPFIEAGRCTNAIQEQLAAMSGNLSTIGAEAPSLSAATNEFHARAQPILKERATIASALSNHVQLTEILEIPKLMETLVRTEGFEDALELANYVGKLKSRYPATKVVLEIAAEVDACCKLMATMLLRLLRRDAQLPECLRYVSYLRRLQVFGEHDLRWHFLACRDCWFEDTVASLAAEGSGGGGGGGGGAAGLKPVAAAGGSAYEQLMQLVDHVRVHGFQIITQYRAIFADDTNAADAGWENSVWQRSCRFSCLSLFLFRCRSLRFHCARRGPLGVAYRACSSAGQWRKWRGCWPPCAGCCRRSTRGRGWRPS